MIEQQTQLAIWAALEVSSFAIALLLAYRSMRAALTPGKRLRRVVETIIVYTVLVSMAYMAWFYFGGTLTLYGSFLFGSIGGGLHCVLMASLLLIVWPLVPQPR